MDKAKLVYLGAGVIFATSGITCGEYCDQPGFSNKVEAGRTKNSIATIVAGIVGQKMYGDSRINLEIQKSFYPDARVTGRTNQNSVDTHVDLAFTSARFTAQKNNEGNLDGEVDKSEFDWKVKQISEDTYEIARFGPKFDATLVITVKDGKISGKYLRPGPHFNWDISGTYDQAGNVNFEIDGPFNLGITLDGKITKLNYTQKIF